MRYTLVIISFFTLSCNQLLQKKNIGNDISSLRIIDTTVNVIVAAKASTNTLDTVENNNYQNLPFDLLIKLPAITDSNNFIKALKENCHLISEPNKGERINYIKKTKIFGSDKEFYIVEYDFRDGANCDFPWKYQIVFDADAKLIKVLSNIRVDIVKVFPKENPFLICVSATGKGNGWHQINRIVSDTLENIYDGFLGYLPKTYDANEDNSINDPNEFHYKVTDVNKDGFNDIVFYGKILLTQGRTKDGFWFDNEIIDGKTVSYSASNPFKIIPASFIFLYNQNNGHFSEKEDYSKKYEYIFGNSK